MRSKELIKSKLISNKNLEDVCFEVNNELLNNNEAGLFITAFIGVLDINTKTLDIVSCGHEKPFLLSNGNAIRLALKSNFILGGVKNYKYHNDSIKLNEGDRLFLHTDGLNESIDDNEIEFGYDRIACCLKDNYYNKLSDILINLDKKLNEFTNNKEQFDDITMLILEMKSSKLEFSFNNPNYEIIEEVTNKFSDYYSYFDKNIISKVSTVIDEVLNNYISYEKKEDLIINISFDYIDDKLVIIFKNNGTSFNPLLKEDKYIKDDTNLLPGGLGITIVKNLSNDVIYDRIDDYNVLKVFFSIK
jgi:sigma-B regulation protein RsbU (phosphoserine phosphatase)